MKRNWSLTTAIVLLLLAAGCGGGGTDGGPGPRIEAIEITTTVTQGTAAAAPSAATAGPVPRAPQTISRTATNVGTVPVRGFILSNSDGLDDPGPDNLQVCQKCFKLKGSEEFGGCNYIHHEYEAMGGIPPGVCQQGFPEHYYMDPGEGYCDVPDENPELDCSTATWRILVVPIVGWAGGGGKLNPGESMGFGAGGGDYSPGTYSLSASVYRWDGTLFDNDAKTITVE